jgi:hypothetical protein
MVGLANAACWLGGGGARAQFSECRPAQMHPGVAETVPVNAPALAFRPAFRSDGVIGLPELQLLDDARGALPFALNDGLVSPTAPLRAGATYHWSYLDACAATSPRELHFDVAFQAVAASPLPTSAGTLEAGRLRRGYIDSGGGGDVIYRLDVGAVPISLRPSPELRPFLSVMTDPTISIDGQAQSVVGFGNAVLTSRSSREPSALVYVRCPTNDPAPFESTVISPGWHDVRLQVGLYGVAKPLPAVGGMMNLTCPLTGSVGDLLVEAPPAGESSTAASSGCSLAGARAPASWAGGAAAMPLTLAAGASRLRRRARRSCRAPS